MGKFKKNIRLKMAKFPEQFNVNNWHKIKNFRQYIERYVTAYNEFKDAAEYWYTTSCMHFLKNIKIPFIIINSEDDPFLDKGHLPVEQAKQNDFITFYITKYGGHTGFILFNKENEYWHKKKVMEFILTHEPVKKL